VSPITQKKKCPVCGYVTKDHRLMNCPNCGTELILDVVLPSLNVQDSFFDIQGNELKETHNLGNNSKKICKKGSKSVSCNSNTQSFI